ncbi:cyclase family protein [Microbacterium sp.]|uniref:cyclase family protein n=1 Tax=Microbacterium sp. TaxID=51671 RepID=UPI0031FF04B9|nr:cyclase family protein [Microbacterium sp.]
MVTIRTQVAGRSVYDLTQPLSPQTPRSSDHPAVKFESVRWFSRHGLRTTNITINAHVGTHVDAPALYNHDGASIDEVGLDRLCGTCVVVDVPKDQWGEIGPEDLEASPVPIEPGDIVVLRTGWHRHYWDEERYILKAPGLGKEGIDWLVEHGVRLVGADLPSPEHIFMRSRQWKDLRPDIFASAEIDPERFPPSYGHKTLFQHGICLLEGLGGEIDALVGKRVDLLTLPLKYVGVEASQARVVALVTE